MNKKISFLRNVAKIVVAALVVATAFTGCKKNKVEPVEKTVVVTGIPEMYTGKMAALSVDNANSSALTIAGINGSSATFRMQDSKTKAPWTGSGNCELVFLIYENAQAMSDKNTLYEGYLSNWKITEETTTIPWNEFLDFKTK